MPDSLNSIIESYNNDRGLYQAVVYITRANMLRDDIDNCWAAARASFDSAHHHFTDEEKRDAWQKFHQTVLDEVYRKPGETWDEWHKRMTALFEEYSQYQSW